MNPYTLIFGKEPAQMIARHMQTAEIIDTFNSDNPSQQVYIITGVRGAGKTVLMTDVAKRLQKNDIWITVELNPERDMLETLVSKLSSNHTLAKLFQSAKINLSLFGFGLEVSGEAPVSDLEIALGKILDSLKRHGKRLLIMVDEAMNSKAMKTFIHSFQILVRQDLPVFLLMTGLYDNIENLQNEKSLTFLYRAPKIVLKPLNIGTIAANYKKNFPVTESEALKMAKMTKGYSFAFQVLGYFCWQQGSLNDAVMEDYRQYLEEYVYEKIWTELSQNDRKIVFGIANCPTGKISEIRSFLNMETNQFNPYRKRLIRKGIINGEEYGYVFFTLPLFEKFVIENYIEVNGNKQSMHSNESDREAKK